MHLLFFLVSGVEVKRGFLGGLEGSKKESGPRLSLDGDKESNGLKSESKLVLEELLMVSIKSPELKL